MQTWEISFNHLLLLYFILLLQEKKDILQRNIQYVYNFYGTDLQVNICREVFRTQSNTYGGVSLRKSQKDLL